MPLTPDEFDLGHRDVITAALWFLKERSPLAFSAEEVAFELGAIGIVYTVAEVAIALAGLGRHRRLESREVDGALYYRYERRLGFRTPSQV